MNRLVSAGIGVLLSLAFAASASAAQLATTNPADPNFTLQGPVAFSAGAVSYPSCRVKLSGTVSASGVATITTMTLLSGVCPLQNLPWTLSATSSTSLQMSGVVLNVGAPYLCGPTTVPMTWTGTAGQFLNVPMTGASTTNCTISGNLAAANLTVVP